MARYYFLLSSLPTLSLGTPPEISFEEFKAMLPLNLEKEDLDLVKGFLTYIDLKNLRAFLLKEPLDPRGTCGEKELEEALLVKDFLPPYVFDFWERYESVRDRLHFFSYLYVHFFKEQEGKGGFLEAFFQEERNLRLILTALRAKLTKRDVAVELQFEDLKDPLIAQILSQKDMEDYEPPREFERVKALFKEYSGNPRKLALAFLEYQLERVEELESEFPPFSIDRVLGYMVRLFLVENWNALDEERGRALIDSIA